MEEINEKEQAKRGRSFRKKVKDPHGSGVNHPFGEVHPFTEGQKKIIMEMLNKEIEGRDLAFSIMIKTLTDVVGYYDWRDMVFATSLGIIIGVIIAHL